MASKKPITYQEQKKRANIDKLKKLQEGLPEFCKDFFRGIYSTTSSLTRIAYAYDLTVFFNYIVENNPTVNDVKEINIGFLEELTSKDIEEYLDYLHYYYNPEGKGLTNDEAGVKRKISSLRSFFNYYQKNGDITSNPTTFVSIPKIHQKEIIRFDPKEVSDFLDNVDTGNKLSDRQLAFHQKTKIRDLAMLTLLLGTGIRVSECVGLDINDVDFMNDAIKITRKGGNESVLYFGEEVRQALCDYMDEREFVEAAPGHENALFLSLQKKRISVRAVENLVKKYAQTVTTIKHITPHKLRSTYGTSLYQETGDIYLVADVLGHADVNTTKRHYAAIADRQRRSAADKVKLRKQDDE